MHALLIDIGNTSLKIGVAGIEGLVASYTLPTDTQQSGDGLGLQLAYLLGHAGFGTPGTGPGNVALDGCVISSVVPGMNPLVAHACERFLELTPRFAHRDLPIPLENRYERPNEVGADRLVGAFGARRLLPDVRSVVSVDYGTATNFDCVTGNAYLGGLICPGVMSSLGALATLFNASTCFCVKLLKLIPASVAILRACSVRPYSSIVFFGVVMSASLVALAFSFV